MENTLKLARVINVVIGQKREDPVSWKNQIKCSQSLSICPCQTDCVGAFAIRPPKQVNPYPSGQPDPTALLKLLCWSCSARSLLGTAWQIHFFFSQMPPFLTSLSLDPITCPSELLLSFHFGDTSFFLFFLIFLLLLNSRHSQVWNSRIAVFSYFFFLHIPSHYNYTFSQEPNLPSIGISLNSQLQPHSSPELGSHFQLPLECLFCFVHANGWKSNSSSAAPSLSFHSCSSCLFSHHSLMYPD